MKNHKYLLLVILLLVLSSIFFVYAQNFNSERVIVSNDATVGSLVSNDNLSVGDIFYLDDGRKARVTGIQEIVSDVDTDSNFDNLNFFANGVLVHNKPVQTRDIPLASDGVDVDGDILLQYMQEVDVCNFLEASFPHRLEAELACRFEVAGQSISKGGVNFGLARDDAILTVESISQVIVRKEVMLAMGESGNAMESADALTAVIMSRMMKERDFFNYNLMGGSYTDYIVRLARCHVKDTYNIKLANAWWAANIKTPDFISYCTAPYPKSFGDMFMGTHKLKDMERLAISVAMHKTEGNIPAASKLLGIDRSTLWRKLTAFNQQGESLDAVTPLMVGNFEGKSLEFLRTLAIKDALDLTKTTDDAAAALGIHRTTLWRFLNSKGVQESGDILSNAEKAARLDIWLRNTCQAVE